jgi:GTPase Era involved in 16S rRNA processing
LTSEAIKSNLNFDSAEHVYLKPTKKIMDESHVKQFLSSATSMDLAMFIVECQKAVKTTKMSETDLTDRVRPMVEYLDKLEQWLDEAPPIE